jgi:hypothetical protein
VLSLGILIFFILDSCENVMTTSLDTNYKNNVNTTTGLKPECTATEPNPLPGCSTDEITINSLQSISALQDSDPKLSVVKYEKQDQQGKAAFNERNPHMTQQQEPMARSPGANNGKKYSKNPLGKKYLIMTRR